MPKNKRRSDATALAPDPKSLGDLTPAYQAHRQETLNDTTRKMTFVNSDVFADVCKQAAFVDKSLFIKEILEGSKTTLITGPKGTGKSLLVSMIDYYFSEWGHPDFNPKVFTSLHIHSIDEGKYRKDYRKYPVVYIDLANIYAPAYGNLFESIKGIMSEVYEKLKDRLFDKINAKERIRYEKILGGSAELNTPEKREIMINSLRDIIGYIARRTNKRVIVLVDNYDRPFLESGENGYYSEASEFLTAFLQAGIVDNKNVHRAVLTANVPVGIEQVFSKRKEDFRLYDMFSPTAGRFFGFSPDEVKEYLNGSTALLTMEEIIDGYGGYQIGSERTLNPHATICVISGEKGRAYPWLHPQEISFIERTDQMKAIKEDLCKIMHGFPLKKRVSRNFDISGLDTNSEAVWSYLLHLGFLTIKSFPEQITVFFDEVEVDLIIPNAKVYQFYLYMLEIWDLDISNYRFAIHPDVMKDRISSFLDAIKESLVGEAAPAREMEALGFVWALNEKREDLEDREKTEERIIEILQKIFPQEKVLRENVNILEFINECKNFKVKLRVIQDKVKRKIAQRNSSITPKEFLHSFKAEQKEMRRLIQDIFAYISRMPSEKLDVVATLVSTGVGENFFRAYPEMKYQLVINKETAPEQIIRYFSAFSQLLEFVLITLGMAPVNSEEGLLGKYAHYFRYPATEDFVTRVKPGANGKEPLSLCGCSKEILETLPKTHGGIDFLISSPIGAESTTTTEYKAHQVLLGKGILSKEYLEMIELSFSSIIKSVESESELWGKEGITDYERKTPRDWSVLFECVPNLIQNISLWLKNRDLMIVLQADPFEQLDELKNRKFLTVDEHKEYSDLLAILSLFNLQCQLSSQSVRVMITPELLEKKLEELDSSNSLVKIGERIENMIKWVEKVKVANAKDKQEPKLLEELWKEEVPRGMCMAM